MRLKKIHVIPPLQFPKKIFSPSVIPPVYTDGIIFRRYIPAESPTDVFRRLIPIDFETELFPSVKIADGNNSVGNAVGVIRFSGSVSSLNYL